MTSPTLERLYRIAVTEADYLKDAMEQIALMAESGAPLDAIAQLARLEAAICGQRAAKTQEKLCKD